MYDHLFFTNILRILDENRGSRKNNSRKFQWYLYHFFQIYWTAKVIRLYELWNGLQMRWEKLLTELLEEREMDSKSLETLVGGKPRWMAERYERLSLVMPSHKAFITRPWINRRNKRQKTKKSKKTIEQYFLLNISLYIIYMYLCYRYIV